MWFRLSVVRQCPAIASLEQFVGGFGKQEILRLAADRFLADFEHDRHGQRRNPVERAVGDMALDSRQHIAKPLDIQKPRRRIVARGLEQDVIGLMAAQYVVDEIGRHRHLPPALFLAGMALVDQAGDHRAIAERALQEEAFVQPGLEIVAEHVLVEQVAQASAGRPEGCAQILQPPDGQRIIGGDEAERLQARRGRAGGSSSMPSVWCASRPSKA